MANCLLKRGHGSFGDDRNCLIQLPSSVGSSTYHLSLPYALFCSSHCRAHAQVLESSLYEYGIFCSPVLLTPPIWEPQKWPMMSGWLLDDVTPEMGTGVILPVLLLPYSRRL